MYETKTLTISCLRILLVIKPCVFTAEEALKIGVTMMILGNSMPFGSPNVIFFYCWKRLQHSLKQFMKNIRVYCLVKRMRLTRFRVLNQSKASLYVKFVSKTSWLSFFHLVGIWWLVPIVLQRSKSAQCVEKTFKQQYMHSYHNKVKHTFFNMWVYFLE